MEAVFQWIKNITYYLLFISLLSYLMPAGKYEQYMKLFFGAVFILLVVSPLAGGLHIEGSLAQAYERIRFTQEQEEFKQKLWGMEEERMAQIMEQYEAAVSQDIRAMADEEGFSCRSAGAKIEEREEKENFGQVVEIMMVIGQGEGEEERKQEGGRSREGSAEGENEGSRKNSAENENEGSRKDGAESENESSRKDGTESENGNSREDDRINREGETSVQEKQDGRMVSIDQVQVVIGEEDKDAWDAAWEEREGEKAEGKDGKGSKKEQKGKEKGDAEKKKMQEAVDEFRRKVARYYGLEEEAVRITWEDD